jgi:hypothetical protein
MSMVVALAWASLIVITELIAFYFIQKNVDDQSVWYTASMIFSVLVFGIVVTFSFRQILIGGTNIPLANLYWIILSQLGSVIMAYFIFNQQILTKDWIATALIFISLLVVYFG